MPTKTKNVTAGDWRTLETYWNATGTGFFRAPGGARIRVRYGGWIFSSNRQVQTLDGETIKRLGVGIASLITARMQMRVTATASVTYHVEPGNVAVLPPGIPI